MLKWKEEDGKKEVGRDTKQQENEDVGCSTVETLNQTCRKKKANPHLSAPSHLHEEGNRFHTKTQTQREIGRDSRK